MFKNESKEKWIAFWLSIAGTIFIIVNIYFKGFSIENLFDALKDICGFAVSIIIVFITSKIIKKYSNFKSKFNKYLKEWVDQNDYLIDSKLKTAGTTDTKEYYYMLTKIHHKNFITREKKAFEFPETYGKLNAKGAFLYIDTKENQEIIFGLSKSAFISKAGEDLEFPLSEIAIQFSTRINEEFGYLNIDAKPKSDGTRITVSIKEVQKTEENAKKLIDLVEFVKTMILAFA
jgi:hypothetical protein